MLARVKLSPAQTNGSDTTVRLMFYTLRVFINAYGYCRLSQCTLTSCAGVCVWVSTCRCCFAGVHTGVCVRVRVGLYIV